MKQFTKPIISGLVFSATVGLIWVSVLASSSLYNLKASNPTNNNQLTASNRDALVAEVENLKSWLVGESIPAGAVMAFDATSCPTWWSRFAEADGRFIMGNTTNSKEKGGNSNIQLTIGQLPAHNFFIAWGSNNDQGWLRDKKNYTISDYHNNDAGAGNHKYRLRATSNPATAGKTNTVGNWDSINIQNPYIKLLYCKKG